MGERACARGRVQAQPVANSRINPRLSQSPDNLPRRKTAWCEREGSPFPTVASLPLRIDIYFYIYFLDTLLPVVARGATCDSYGRFLLLAQHLCPRHLRHSFYQLTESPIPGGSRCPKWQRNCAWARCPGDARQPAEAYPTYAFLMGDGGVLPLLPRSYRICSVHVLGGL